MSHQQSQQQLLSHHHVQQMQQCIQQTFQQHQLGKFTAEALKGNKSVVCN